MKTQAKPSVYSKEMAHHHEAVHQLRALHPRYPQQLTLPLRASVPFNCKGTYAVMSSIRSKSWISEPLHPKETLTPSSTMVGLEFCKRNFLRQHSSGQSNTKPIVQEPYTNFAIIRDLTIASYIQIARDAHAGRRMLHSAHLGPLFMARFLLPYPETRNSYAKSWLYQCPHPKRLFRFGHFI